MALLFSLGILAMMLVLGLVFATNAMIDRKVAAGHNDSTTAKLLAQSAVQRAMIAVDYLDEYGFFSYSALGGDKDEIVEQFGNLPGGLAIDTTSPEIQWQYVFRGAGTAADPRRILGRIAYSFVGEDGLDPAACVKFGVDEGAASEARPGVDVSEINLTNLGAPMTATYATDMSFFSDGGTLPDYTRWVDFDQLFGYLSLPLPPDTTREDFRNWFVISQAADPEGVWLDDGDGIQETGELYHRFNLARTDWDTPITVEQLLGASAGNTPAEWKAGAGTHNGTCIPWLVNHTNLPAETFFTQLNRAQQIAANLIDYCDSNDVPTSNVDPGTWSGSIIPLYTGNEKTPYINEITVDISSTLTILQVDHPPAASDYTYTYGIGFELGGELINIYNENLGSADLKVYGELKYRVHGVVHSVALEDKTITISIDDSNYKHDDVLVLDPTDTSTGKFVVTGVANATSADFEIIFCKIKCAVLVGKDYAKSDDADVFDGKNKALFTNADGDGSNSSIAFSMQARDPRQNLNLGDWDYAAGDKGSTLLTFAGATPGDPNNNADAVPSGAADKDVETKADAGFTGGTGDTLSTAYIRNAPMQSPWEIGLIHRGAMWETINLDAYNNNKIDGSAPDANQKNGVLATKGISEYAHGDANILDQIKMTNKTRVFGKVNINIAEADVQRALFQNVQVGSAAVSPGTGGSAIAAGTADTIASAVLATNGAAGTAFFSRAQIADVVALTDGTGGTQTTDATKEEIIGKVVNLLKTRTVGGNTLVVVAQTIKDVGKNVHAFPAEPDMTVIKYVHTPTDITGSPKHSVDSDNYVTISECELGSYERYADEIMATTKILAEVAMDPVTQKWRIVRYEYLQE